MSLLKKVSRYQFDVEVLAANSNPVIALLIF
jgi:hypothetical protein